MATGKEQRFKLITDKMLLELESGDGFCSQCDKELKPSDKSDFCSYKCKVLFESKTEPTEPETV